MFFKIVASTESKKEHGKSAEYMFDFDANSVNEVLIKTLNDEIERTAKEERTLLFIKNSTSEIPDEFKPKAPKKENIDEDDLVFLKRIGASMYFSKNTKGRDCFTSGKVTKIQDSKNPINFVLNENYKGATEFIEMEKIEVENINSEAVCYSFVIAPLYGYDLDKTDENLPELQANKIRSIWATQRKTYELMFFIAQDIGAKKRGVICSYLNTWLFINETKVEPIQNTDSYKLESGFYRIKE